MLYPLGNAAMLPLLGQAAVACGPAEPTTVTAWTIAVAQTVMIPAALLAGRHAERHGYKTVVIAALVVLPLRGAAAGARDSHWAAIPAQMLDGVGAGLLGVELPGLVAQVLRAAAISTPDSVRF